MANGVSKIERYGLVERVQKLLYENPTLSGRELSRLLNEDLPEGQSITPQAVNAYLKKVRGSTAQETREIIKNHLDRVVPNDLQTLEHIEAICLAWFDESIEDRRSRLAKTVSLLEGELDYWYAELSHAIRLRSSDNPKDRENASKPLERLVKKLMSLIQDDDAEQERRLKAARMIEKVIDLKISKAALLSDDAKGRIIIVDHRPTEEELESGEFKYGGQNSLSLLDGGKGS